MQNNSIKIKQHTQYELKKPCERNEINTVCLVNIRKRIQREDLVPQDQPAVVHVVCRHCYFAHGCIARFSSKPVTKVYSNFKP